MRIQLMRTLFYSILLCLHPLIVLAQTDTASFYFPLKSGSLWQYKEPPPLVDPYIYETRSATDTTFQNGKTYRSFVTGVYGYPDTTGTYYDRQEGAKVYQYFPLLQIEAVVFDFSKKVGDTISVFPRSGPFGISDTSIVTVLDTGKTTISGRKSRYMTFYDRTIHSSNYWITQVTDSIGITFSQTEPGFQLYLVGARIEGIEYGIVVNVAKETHKRPNDFALYQNYPNPFNPSTAISFQLQSRASIKLSVWNVSGAKVRDLFKGTLTEGLHTIFWNGKGNDDSVLPSGVYFYRLEANESFEVRKAVLLH